MFFRNYKIQQNASILFLIIFLAFLSISVSHSHHFEYVFNSKSEITSEHDNIYLDPLLDSSLNCTIHTFFNTLKLAQKFYLKNNPLKYYSSTIIPSYNFYFSIITSSSNQLRAPPKYLV